MALHILAEAALRIEHKLDQLLKHLKVKPQLMQFYDNQCPVCLRPVKYIIDVQHNVAKRSCDCKSGMQPSIIDLTPGAPNGNEASSKNREDRTAPADDDRRRGQRSSR